MEIRKYKINDTLIHIYSVSDEFATNLPNAELVDDDELDVTIPIIRDQYYLEMCFKRKNRDTILFRENILSVSDIYAARKLIHLKSLNCSRKIRELIISKYNELIKGNITKEYILDNQK